MKFSEAISVLDKGGFVKLPGWGKNQYIGSAVGVCFDDPCGHHGPYWTYAVYGFGPGVRLLWKDSDVSSVVGVSNVWELDDWIQVECTDDFYDREVADDALISMDSEEVKQFMKKHVTRWPPIRACLLESEHGNGH